jgi:hypothetical protein
MESYKYILVFTSIFLLYFSAYSGNDNDNKIYNKDKKFQEELNPKPDLVIERITPNNYTPKKKETINVELVIKNQGTDYAKYFFICLYCNLSSSPKYGDGLESQIAQSVSLPPGDTQLIIFREIYLADTATWYMYGLIDCYEEVDESNENNNTIGPTIVKISEDKVELKEGKYIPQVLISAPWGEKNVSSDNEPSKPGTFGLWYNDQGIENGPPTFTVAPNGDIYIADIINDRVQRFKADGQFISVIPNVRVGVDGMYVDRAGNIYASNFNWTFYPVVKKYDQTGKLLITYHLGKWDDFGNSGGGYHSFHHWSGNGSIYGDSSGKLFLSYDKMDRPLFPDDTIFTDFILQFGTAEEEFTFEQQMSTLQTEGSWGLSSNIPDGDKFLRKISNNLFFVDSKKNTDEGVLGKFIVGEAKPFGIDKEAIYTITLDKGNPDIRLIEKFDYKGNPIAIYKLDFSQTECELLTSFNAGRTMIFDKGNLYVFCSDKKGIKIIKWSPVEVGK